MSVHDEGYGDNARPTLEFESDFANRFRSVGAEGDQSWGAPTHTPHRSEESFMTSGAGRPGQPRMGQGSIFGTGRGPFFAQMPPYTPVTRGSEPQPQPQNMPEPTPDFGTYARQNGVDARSLGHANQNSIPSYQSPSSALRTYTTPDFPNPFPPQTYQPQQSSYPPQSYRAEPGVRPAASQPVPSQSAQPAHAYQPQTPPMPQSPQPGHGYQAETPAARSYNDSGFPKGIFPAEPAPNAGFAGQNFSDASCSDASFGDASFPDAGFPGAFQDASFPEEPQGYPEAQDYAGSPSHADMFNEHEPTHPADAGASGAADLRRRLRPAPADHARRDQLSAPE